jgi:hypothetical protein
MLPTYSLAILQLETFTTRREQCRLCAKPRSKVPTCDSLQADIAKTEDAQRIPSGVTSVVYIGHFLLMAMELRLAIPWSMRLVTNPGMVM